VALSAALRHLLGSRPQEAPRHASRITHHLSHFLTGPHPPFPVKPSPNKWLSNPSRSSTRKSCASRCGPSPCRSGQWTGSPNSSTGPASSLPTAPTVSRKPPCLVLWGVSPVTYCGTVRMFLGAKRLECVQLAGAVVRRGRSESGSKLHALQTLRDTGMPIFLYVSVFRAAHT